MFLFSVFAKQHQDKLNYVLLKYKMLHVQLLLTKMSVAQNSCTFEVFVLFLFCSVSVPLMYTKHIKHTHTQT